MNAAKLTVKNCILFKKLNLTINEGEFIWVIGEVGSGKSSLISALLGDMIYVSDKTINEFGEWIMDSDIHDVLCDKSMQAKDVVRLGGSVWLVQQNPWIQNKTIRDNIIFGLPFYKDKYKKTIETCQLSDDLKILKGGDQTEIGERGINLSGGQKARISLARAVYSGKDIVLMDDPVSALDSGVKHKIFEEVFCGELKHKTRILITHAVDFLHLADRIVIMENGAIKHMGSFEELEHSDEIKYVIETIAKTDFEEENSSGGSENNFDTTPRKDETFSSRNNMSFSEDYFQIIEDENNEAIQVGFHSYKNLFIKDWNWITYTISIPFLVAYSYFGIYSTYYWGVWIKESQNNSLFWQNFIKVTTYAVGFAFTRNIVAMLIYFSTIRMSRLLHERMIRRLVNAPINTYFDKTPSGNILNRFSRDISKLDEEVFRYWTNHFEFILNNNYCFKCINNID